MRLTSAFLITRLVLQPGFWALMLVLIVFGSFVKMCDRSVHDYVCFGYVRYDYNDANDRKKLLGEMKAIGAETKDLSIPPCSVLGERWYSPEERARIVQRLNDLAAHPEHWDMKAK